MAFMYQNVADAEQHLRGTVVMFDGMPAYVHSVTALGNGRFLANLGHLPRINNTFEVDLFDARLDPKGIRLGYVNCTKYGEALFCSRIPARQYHQGLHQNNVNVARSHLTDARVTSFPYMLSDPGFADALRNIYPTFNEALNLLSNPEYRLVAFHRYFAVTKDELGFYRIHYRGSPVAYGEPDKMRLPKKFAFLKEQLQELGINAYV